MRQEDVEGCDRLCPEGRAQHIKEEIMEMRALLYGDV